MDEESRTLMRELIQEVRTLTAAIINWGMEKRFSDAAMEYTQHIHTRFQQ
jgi:hypothetical protein